MPGSSARLPVVKSCSRVPTPRITSASRASVLAAELPVTPIEPTACGWSQAMALLPAWVSATGMRCLAAKAVSVAVASLNSTPPPATISGRSAVRSSSTTRASSSGSAPGRRMVVRTCGAKKLSG